MHRGTARPLALFALAALLSLAALAPAPPALAAPGAGATVSRAKFCRDVSPGLGFILCSTLHLVSQETTTPSGRTLIVSNSRYTYTYTGPDGALLSKGGDHSHFRSSSRGEMLEALSQQSRNVIKTPTSTCVTKSAFKLVGDEVRFERYEFTCSGDAGA